LSLVFFMDYVTR